MRNLKKVLSLVLATVMTMGLMMVGANAFSDDASIENGEAVGIVSSLGIIGGYPDGSYKPEKTVSRAEMAKMICVMLNGGEDPVIGVKDVPTFTDVRNSADAWAEEYIEYCYSNGIVSGVGDNKFAPSRAVTGSEAAKMLLVALGYPADITGQEFTGPDWKMNVNTVANSSYNKLYAGLAKTAADVALTRDQAAQMIYNTLNAYVVEETFSKDITTGKYNVSFDRTNETMLTAQFNVDIYTAVVNKTETGSVVTGNGAADGKTEFALVAMNNVTATGTKTWNVTTDNSMLGKEVKVMVQTTKDNKEVVLGDVVLTETNNVLAMTTAASSAAKLGEKLDDADLALGANSKYVVNGYGATTAVTTNAAAHALMGNGIAVEFIDNNDDGVVDFMMITDKEIGKVATYSTKGDGYISVTGITGASFNSADPIDGTGANKVNGFEDLAKDDIVLYYVNADGEYVVEAAESVNVTPSATNGNNAIANGVTYKKSGLATKLNTSDATTLATAVTLNEDATFYLDNYGYVVYVKDVTAATEYLFVTGLKFEPEAGFKSLTAKGILADGTSVTVDVAKFNNTKVADLVAGDGAGKVSTTNDINQVYSYTVNNSGAYNLTNANDITAVTDNKIVTNKAALGTGVSANSKTVFVIKDGDNWTVYTGIANVPEVENITTVGGDKNSSNVAKIVYAIGDVVGGVERSVYILNATPTITKNGDELVYTYKALLDGEFVDGGLVVDNGGSNPGVAVGLYKDVTIDVNGAWAYNSETAETANVVTACGNGVITAGSTYTYTDDTKVILIDASDKAVVAYDLTADIIDENNNNHSAVVVTDEDDDNLAVLIYVIQA